MKEYIIYNLNNSTTYFNAGIELYFLLLLGILIPPLSVFLFYGYFSQWKKMLVVFLPSFVFFAFHTYFPNKQERFILPFLPFLIILGIMGYYALLEKTQSGFLRKSGMFGWKFFWIINFILIIPVSVMYSKRSRVETMTYLGEQKDYQNFIVENSNSNIYIEPPQFYSQHWVSFGYFNDTTTIEWLHQWMQSVARDGKQPVPNYILFVEEKNLEQRITNMKKLFPDLEYKTTVHPGFLDRVLHWLNPVNRNESCVIYRITKMPVDITNKIP